MTTRLCLALFLAILLVGCDKFTLQRATPEKSASGWKDIDDEGLNRYQLSATSDGKMFRLDRQTGQTSLVTEKGLSTLPDDRRIQLKVGAIYELEDGKLSALYEGNLKFTTDTRRIADALIKKVYADKKPPPHKDKPTGIDWNNPLLKDHKPRAEDSSKKFVRDCEGRLILAPPPGYVLECNDPVDKGRKPRAEDSFKK